MSCSFVVLVPKHGDLLEKLAKRGLKLFPDAPEFPMMMGTVEMEKGPFRANLDQARKHFEAALKLAQAQESSDPKVARADPRHQEGRDGPERPARRPDGHAFPLPRRQEGQVCRPRLLRSDRGDDGRR